VEEKELATMTDATAANTLALEFEIEMSDVVQFSTIEWDFSVSRSPSPSLAMVSPPSDSAEQVKTASLDTHQPDSADAATPEEYEKAFEKDLSPSTWPPNRACKSVQISQSSLSRYLEEQI